MGGFRRMVVISVLIVVLASAFNSATSGAAPGTPKAGQAVAVKQAAPAKGEAAPVKNATANPTSIPQIPVIETVTAEGLGTLVNWKPDPASNHVTLYTLTARVVPGFPGTVSGVCAAPPATSASSGSSALVGGLCARIPYAISMTATNAKGTSAASLISKPVVPFAARKPNPPVITSVVPTNTGLVVSWSAL